MDWTSGKLHARKTISRASITMGIIAASLTAPALAQVRGKAPDRGVYQPPRLNGGNLEPGSSIAPLLKATQQRSDARLADMIRTEVDVAEPRPADESEGADQVSGADDNNGRPLVSIALEIQDPDQPSAHLKTVTPIRVIDPKTQPRLQPVSHERVLLVPPSPPADIPMSRAAARTRTTDVPAPVLPASPKLARVSNESPLQLTAAPLYEHGTTCDGCDQCAGVACDSIGCGIYGCDSCGDGCDTLGCDSMGGCGTPWYKKWNYGSLSFSRDRWFGSVEYLMMWSRGDRFPPLITTDTSANPDPDTAGQIGEANTLALVGRDKYMDRLASGGRITVGTWLDNRECFALVGRGWYGGRKEYTYGQNQGQTSILTRPFFNVTDGQLFEQDTQLVAFPDRVDGSVFVDADLESYGADISLRQFLYSDLGVTLDLVYGYQFMRMNERLGIASTSTSLDDDFAPVGAMLSVADAFSVSNEFHGGQFGLAANYRECCWSFNGLAKVGFGSLNRSATRRGVTVTQIDDDTNVTNSGLLVRNTNDGTVTDSTFGWIPELDFSLGWHRFKGWDLTCGYHLIVMTDAIQASGAIDPDLAVNLAEPPEGQQRPTDNLYYRTFYLQGIHFGVQHNY